MLKLVLNSVNLIDYAVGQYFFFVQFAQNNKQINLSVSPGKGLPVTVHSSSVEKPDRMVRLMMSPEEEMLGGSERQEQ